MDKKVELFKFVKSKPCIICNVYGCDPCHIKSVGAGGLDNINNLLPMCRKHHSEQHSKGWIYMIEKYKILLPELTSRGFEVFEQNGYKKLIKVKY